MLAKIRWSRDRLGHPFALLLATLLVLFAFATPVAPLDAGDEPPDTIELQSGGQFLFWSAGDGFAAAELFATVTIVWLFNVAAISWTSFIPDLGLTNFTIEDGDILWVVSDGPQTIAFGEAGNGPINGDGPIQLVDALGGRFFNAPVDFGPYPGGRVFVVELVGLVLLFDLDGGGESTVIDLRTRVGTTGGEKGLLSVALDPSFADNGFLYAYYTLPDAPFSQLSRFTVTDNTADLFSEVLILQIDQFAANHNGGSVRFGPDGMLYLSLGDGGGAGDPEANGQDLSTLLGSVLRIDVSATSQNNPYDIPPDNPFLSTPGARPEIWAHGLRNPWRMAFDPATGELWLGDVGQSSLEEIDVIQRGGNYGWNTLEGTACFDPPANCDDSGTVGPVVTYTHDDGCSVTGGVVYRGGDAPSLQGDYLYSDFCSGTLWAVNAASPGAARVIAETGRSVSSFGVDAGGSAYILAFDGPILQIAAP